jgi:hypothetical protein
MSSSGTLNSPISGSAHPLKIARAHLRNVKTGAVTTRLVDGIFIVIGHTPATSHVCVAMALSFALRRARYHDQEPVLPFRF